GAFPVGVVDGDRAWAGVPERWRSPDFGYQLTAGVELIDDLVGVTDVGEVEVPVGLIEGDVAGAAFKAPRFGSRAVEFCQDVFAVGAEDVGLLAESGVGVDLSGGPAHRHAHEDLEARNPAAKRRDFFSVGLIGENGIPERDIDVVGCRVHGDSIGFFGDYALE